MTSSIGIYMNWNRNWNNEYENLGIVIEIISSLDRSGIGIEDIGIAVKIWNSSHFSFVYSHKAIETNDSSLKYLAATQIMEHTVAPGGHRNYIFVSGPPVVINKPPYIVSGSLLILRRSLVIISMPPAMVSGHSIILTWPQFMSVGIPCYITGRPHILYGGLITEGPRTLFGGGGGALLKITGGPLTIIRDPLGVSGPPLFVNRSLVIVRVTPVIISWPQVL